jgi:hypothetical protein
VLCREFLKVPHETHGVYVEIARTPPNITEHFMFFSSYVCSSSIIETLARFGKGFMSI